MGIKPMTLVLLVPLFELHKCLFKMYFLLLLTKNFLLIQFIRTSQWTKQHHLTKIIPRILWQPQVNVANPAQRWEIWFAVLNSFGHALRGEMESNQAYNLSIRDLSNFSSHFLLSLENLTQPFRQHLGLLKIRQCYLAWTRLSLSIIRKDH